MDTKTSSGGIGFPGMLGLMFIAFKLLGVIQWPWLWVLSPLWLPITIVAGVFVVPFVVAVVAFASTKISSLFQRR